MKQSALILVFCTASAVAQPDHQLEWAARGRLVHVDETHATGKAASLLLRGNLESTWSRRVSTFLELDYVATGWRDFHSDGARLNGQPLIPDVAGRDLNQAFLTYRGRGWRLHLGRQGIAFDDQRFIGGNGFWQNEQTFDAAHLDWRWLSASRIDYAYIANVNRIYGEDAPPANAAGTSRAVFGGDHEHHTHLLHLQLNEWDAMEWQIYAYAIDNLDLPSSSNRTFGSKYQYNFAAGPLKYEAVAALAVQERPELAGSPLPLYHLFEMAGLHGPWRGVLRYERMGSDEGTNFATPLASGHDFEGWADVFGAIPAVGLEEGAVQLHWRASPWEIDLRYLRFWEQQGGNRFGSEIDMEVEFKPTRRQRVAVRYADFNSASPLLSDTRKVFLDYSVGL